MDRRVGPTVALATPMLFAINMTYSSLSRHLFRVGRGVFLKHRKMGEEESYKQRYS